jgi:hypothetical protein
MKSVSEKSVKPTKREKLIDPRRPIGEIKVPALTRRVFLRLRRERILLRGVSKLVLIYEETEILAALETVLKSSLLRTRMIARFGVFSAADELAISAPTNAPSKPKSRQANKQKD